jgi:hypothetical protein
VRERIQGGGDSTIGGTSKRKKGAEEESREKLLDLRVKKKNDKFAWF